MQKFSHVDMKSGTVDSHFRLQYHIQVKEDIQEDIQKDSLVDGHEDIYVDSHAQNQKDNTVMKTKPSKLCRQLCVCIIFAFKLI